MPLHHYLPASYLALFSDDTVTMPSRQRKIFVGDKKDKRIFESSASNVGAVNNLYTLADLNSDPQLVDQTWTLYERSLPSAINALIEGNLDAETWARVLVPFVACMLVRGPDFNKRFPNRLKSKGMDTSHIISPDNINQARLMELQRLLGPVTAAKWVVLSVYGEENLITNDLGYTPFINSFTQDFGMAIPLGLRKILVIVPQEERVIAIAKDDKWLPVINYEDLPVNNHLDFNRAIAGNAQRYTFGLDSKTLSRYLKKKSKSPISPEPVQLGFMAGTQALAHEFTWHRFVSAIRRHPTDTGEWNFPLNWQEIASGWHSAVWFPTNLLEFPPAIQRQGSEIRVKFYDAEIYFKISEVLMYQNAEHLDEFVTKCGELLPSITDKVLKVRVLIARGGARADLGDYDGGLADLFQAVSEDPQNAHAHCDFGYCLIKVGKLDDAIRELSKAIKLDSNLGPAYLNRGQAFSEKNKLDRALKDLTKAVELLPEGPAKAGAFRNRAELYIKTDEYLEAIQDFSKAIQFYSDPKEKSSCLYRRAIGYLLLNQFSDVLENLNECFKLTDPTYDQLCFRGQIYSKLDQNTDALKDFEDAIPLASDVAEKVNALDQSASQLSKLLRYKEALSRLDQAIALTPKLPSLHYHKGYTFLLLAKFKAASKAFNIAITLNPKHAQALNNQGVVLALLHRHKNAIETFEKVFAAEPDDSDRVSALRNMALSSALLGDFYEADRLMIKVDQLAPDAFFTLIAKGRLEVLRGDYDKALTIQMSAERVINNLGWINVFKAVPLFAQGDQTKGLDVIDYFLNHQPMPMETAILLNDMRIIYKRRKSDSTIKDVIALLKNN